MMHFFQDKISEILFLKQHRIVLKKTTTKTEGHFNLLDLCNVVYPTLNILEQIIWNLKYFNIKIQTKSKLPTI
jgi:hypothetical protein